MLIIALINLNSFSGNKRERTCGVDNLKFAVQLEEENKDFVLPENSVRMHEL